MWYVHILCWWAENLPEFSFCFFAALIRLWPWPYFSAILGLPLVQFMCCKNFFCWLWSNAYQFEKMNSSQLFGEFGSKLELGMWYRKFATRNFWVAATLYGYTVSSELFPGQYSKCWHLGSVWLMVPLCALLVHLYHVMSFILTYRWRCQLIWFFFFLCLVSWAHAKSQEVEVCHCWIEQKSRCYCL